MSRPAPRFRDFIGHQQAVNLLRRQVAGAQKRGIPFPHAGYLGPSGVGKTMLARAVAAEFGTTVTNAMGYSTRSDLTAKFRQLRQGDFLLIDECHRLGLLEQELLCQAIDELSIPEISTNPKDQKSAETTPLIIPPWTLALCTDQPGRLLDALHKKLEVRFRSAAGPPKCSG